MKRDGWDFPFCVTIDREAGTYLPLPIRARWFLYLSATLKSFPRLPLLYAQLTRA